MKDFIKDKNKVLAKWAYFGILCIIMWRGIETYSIAYSSDFPNLQTGQVYTEVYKENIRYITLTEYILIRALPICFFSLILIVNITERIRTKRELEEVFQKKK